MLDATGLVSTTSVISAQRTGVEWHHAIGRAQSFSGALNL